MILFRTTNRIVSIAWKSQSWMLVLACWLETAGRQSLHAADKDATDGSKQPTILDYTVRLDTVMSGFDGKTCWEQKWVAVIRGIGQNEKIILQDWFFDFSCPRDGGIHESTRRYLLRSK